MKIKENMQEEIERAALCTLFGLVFWPGGGQRRNIVKKVDKGEVERARSPELMS
jgi:hypothetical protein